MNITDKDLTEALDALVGMRQATPWYRFERRYKLTVMHDTLTGIMEWMVDRAGNSPKRSCGCAAHNNPHTN